MAKSKPQKITIQAAAIYAAALEVLKSHWQVLLPLTALPLIIDYALLATVFSDVRDSYYLYDTSEAESLNAVVEQLPEDFFLYIAATALIASIFIGATIIALLKIFSGSKKVELFDVLSKSLERYWEYFSVFFVVGALVVGGLILLVLPGLAAGFFLMFAAHVRLQKNLSVMKSISMSYQIVRNSWKLVLITAFGILGIIITTELVASLFSMSENSQPIGANLAWVILTIPTGAWAGAIFTKLYLEIDKTFRDSDKWQLTD